MANRESAMEMLNRIRDKAKLNNDFSKSMAIRLKAGKIKFQLVAPTSDNLFKSRIQHMIPTVPEEEDKNEKWLVADCKGEGCPVCAAAAAFKNSGITVGQINEAYNPKYPYKYIRNVFTQPEHYLLCAKILTDDADEGSYLPKDEAIGSTQLIQFPRTALNNLMAAYEDFMDDYETEGKDDDVPSLFAVAEDGDKVRSLVITCRVTNQPYSCTFSFNKSQTIDFSEISEEKLNVLKETIEVPSEHYDKCVDRIQKIRNYFIKESVKDEDDDVPFDMSSEKKSVSSDDDFDIDDML